jgi:phosphatidylglycerophosphate synthase
MERLERIIVLCAGLILDPFLRFSGWPGPLAVALLVIAVFSHITALQRFWRARARIRASEKR